MNSIHIRLIKLFVVYRQILDCHGLKLAALGQLQVYISVNPYVHFLQNAQVCRYTTQQLKKLIIGWQKFTNQRRQDLKDVITKISRKIIIFFSKLNLHSILNKFLLPFCRHGASTLHCSLTNVFLRTSKTFYRTHFQILSLTEYKCNLQRASKTLKVKGRKITTEIEATGTVRYPHPNLPQDKDL